MYQFTALVSDHQLLSGSFRYLRLELINPDRIEFRAGQYVILTIDAAKGIRRNYSIASQPDMDHAIDLLIDVKPHGPGSTYLQNLKPGDRVEFAAPFGSFVVQDSCLAPRLPILRRQLLFAATGSGISPIRSMIFDLLQIKKYQDPIRLWWGMRNQEDCFWVEDFDHLEKEYPNFKWDLVLSHPPDGWPLHTGHVTDPVLNYVQHGMKNEELRMTNNTSTHSTFNIQHSTFCIYLCGNRFMIEEVSTMLQKTGISTEHIHTEKFF